MLRWFPLLLFSLIFYNLLIFAGTWMTGTDAATFLARSLTFSMFSGEQWRLMIGDIIVVGTLALLFFEIVKATRTTSTEVLNHGLSMITFVVALIEFILMKGFATSTFFLIVAMCFFDVVAGFTISIVAAKRDLGATGGLIGTN